MRTLLQVAAANLLALLNNPYPGRGIILGMTPGGALAVIYFITARSAPSRNRVIEPIDGQHGWLKTSVADWSKPTGNPDLTLYTVMAEAEGIHAVSNGRQTEDLLRDGTSALESDRWQYEDDPPNFTPRISGIIRRLPHGEPQIELVMLRKSPSGDECDRFVSAYGKANEGLGYYFSTYEGDGNPLPPFHGEPLIVPIGDNDPVEIAETYRASLDPDNWVAVAVKVIPGDGPSQTHIINRYEKVQVA